MAKSKRQKRKRISAKRGSENYSSGQSTSYLKIPDGISTFKAKAKSYRLDFHYYVAGKGNPIAEPGDECYERSFFVHKNIGPNSEWHLCPARTFKKPCPICEYLKKKRNDPDLDEDEIKDLNKNFGAKERRLYIVRDLEDGVDSPIMIYNESVHTFGKALYNKIDNADEDDGYDFFAAPEDGLTVKVLFKQADAGKWLEVGDLEFKPRKHSYDENIAEEMPCLDDILVATPYEKLKKLFLAADEEDSKDDDDVFPEYDENDDEVVEEKEEEKKPSTKKTVVKKKVATTADDVGIKKGDVVLYDDEEHTVVRISPDGTSLTLEDEDEQVIKAISPDDVEKVPQSSDEDDEDDEEEEKPTKKVAKKPTKKATKKPVKKAPKKKVEEEEEDDDDDPTDDELEDDEDEDEDEDGWDDFDDDDE